MLKKELSGSPMLISLVILGWYLAIMTIISFQFLKLINLFILLYNIVLVLPYIDLNLPWVYMCSPSWTPPPTSFPIPFLWVIPGHQPRAPCIMHRTWTGNSFHIWYYTCFNSILPNHPTLSLSHRVQNTVLYICVSLLLSCIQGYHYYLSKNLNIITNKNLESTLVLLP